MLARLSVIISIAVLNNIRSAYSLLFYTAEATPMNQRPFPKKREKEKRRQSVNLNLFCAPPTPIVGSIGGLTSLLLVNI